MVTSFPWGFRALGLGKTDRDAYVGRYRRYRLVTLYGWDGHRVPFFTSFDPKTGNWIIENQGVDPDILIDNDPVKKMGTVKTNSLTVPSGGHERTPETANHFREFDTETFSK